MKSKSGLHRRNKHNKGYDFEKLLKFNPSLEEFVRKNNYGNLSINFSDPKAVKELNRALLFSEYKIQFWDFPDNNLCPPVPGRVDYIHHIADLMSVTNDKSNDRILDIGTGASCIYPLLGNAVYHWSFVGTDIDGDSLISAQKIIDNNQLNDKIELRFQPDKNRILQGIVKENETFSMTMCNPPFYKSEAEAKGANSRKSRNLGNNAIRNFGGNNNELWYEGGEKAFIHTYLYESSMHPKVSKWFTSLLSSKDHIKGLEKSSGKLGAKEFKVIPMHQGNKVTRIVAWQF